MTDTGSNLRVAQQAERRVQAEAAWKDYHTERDVLARRTEKLREMRLAAEAEAAKAAAPAKTRKAPAAKKRAKA